MFQFKSVLESKDLQRDLLREEGRGLVISDQSRSRKKNAVYRRILSFGRLQQQRRMLR